MKHITLAIYLAFLLAACATSPPPELNPPDCTGLTHEECLYFTLIYLNQSAPNSTGFDHSWGNQDTFLRPYRKDAYGPGLHSDATGRPFRWRTKDGQLVPPGGRVRPDAYGLGVGMDQFGRPVKPEPWQAQ